MIAAGIALIPDRFPRSLETIESLLPQVDEILLSLNDFDHIPKGISNPKIKVCYKGANIGDIGKFHKWKGDFISCDDDLIYPETYIEDFLAASKQYPDTILTHHGNAFEAPVDNWFTAKNEDPKAVRCLQGNKEIQALTCPGTGVSYYPASLYPSVYKFVKDSREWNCQDMVVGAWLKREESKAIALTHGSRYFGYTHPINTIWEETIQNREKQTDKFNRILA